VFDNTFLHRVIYKSLCVLVLLASVACWAFTPSPSGGGLGWGLSAPEPPPGWRPLSLSEVEARFARHFPGTITRLTDGRQVMVLRAVHRPTRMLHPAIDCYRALGYRIAAQRLQLDERRHLWRCFDASRGATQLRVCERIVDASGTAFTDTSAWYWLAVVGKTSGPWLAVTIASPL
jgi:hypothetical protein